MGYRTLKMYVFSNLYMGYSYCNKRYKEVRVIAETILEAKKKVRESGYKDLKFEKICIAYERT